MVVPVVKKGDGGKVSNYRGVTLMQTAYKVYATLLTERLREEVKEKRILLPSQTGFREGMGTMDNICTELRDKQEGGRKERKNGGVILGRL